MTIENDRTKPQSTSTRGQATRRPLTNREKDVVRALACVMWIDGHAAPAARKVIEHVISAFDPSEDEWREMMSWLSEDVSTIADVRLESLSDEQKEILIADAVLVARADDVELPSEKTLLKKLAARLGIDDESVKRVVATARDDGALSLPSSALVDRVSLPTPEQSHE